MIPRCSRAQTIANLCDKDKRDLSKIKKIHCLYSDNDGVFHSEVYNVVYINSEYLVILVPGDPRPRVLETYMIYINYEDAVNQLALDIESARSPYFNNISGIHKYAVRPPKDNTTFDKNYKIATSIDSPVNELKQYFDEIKADYRLRHLRNKINLADKNIEHVEAHARELNKRGINI